MIKGVAVIVVTAVLLAAPGTVGAEARSHTAVAGERGSADGIASPRRGVAHTASSPVKVWRQQTTGEIVGSSPAPAVLDSSGSSILVGDESGAVYALHASDGSSVAGWPVHTVAPVDSSPTVAYTSGGGLPDVYVSSGNATSYALSSGRGGLYSFGPDGHERWETTEPSPNAIGLPWWQDSPLQATPSVGNFAPLAGADTFDGTLGLQSWAYSELGNRIWPTESFGGNPYSPFYQNDTIYSSAAIADLDGSGSNRIIVGGDASGGPPPPPLPQAGCAHAGGCIREVDGSTGNVLWQFDTDEAIVSSPAIGNVAANGQEQIVVGAGDFYYLANQGRGLPEPADSTKVFVLNADGSLHCAKDLGQVVFGSPALADIEGNGNLDIVIGTMGTNQGQIWVLDGNCNPLPNWPQASPGGVVIGSIVTADLTGAATGAQDLLVPTGAGVYAFQGTTGKQLFALGLGETISYQNSPLVVDEGGGKLGIYTAGINLSANNGVVTKYELNTGGSIGRLSWPMFHLNPRHTGAWADSPLTDITGFAMQPGGSGYWMASVEGAVFQFGSATYDGSIADVRTSAPIDAIAATPDGRGYWLAQSDGGVETYGANFYGSMGGKPLNKPIVGMAATHDGKGYWLVSSDGGIFSFGDATFYGSTGAIPLNRPIVGMAPTPDGKGYWFVASDGGIFSFGDANFYGSTGALRLNKPIVGMAPTPKGEGYWMVASDGGIFTFGNAGFFGSAGSLALSAPVVAMASTSDGKGYVLVGSDGSVLTYGDATFNGSMSQYG